MNRDVEALGKARLLLLLGALSISPIIYILWTWIQPMARPMTLGNAQHDG